LRCAGTGLLLRRSTEDFKLTFSAAKTLAVIVSALFPAIASVTAPAECRWTHSLITIDGRADEPAWQRAQWLTNFAAHWLPARPPAECAAAASVCQRRGSLLRARPNAHSLLYRVSHRGESHMPPLATTLGDEPSAQMLREWIAAIKP
jgi:hypothetical protein